MAGGPIAGVNASAILMVRVQKAEQVASSTMPPKHAQPRAGTLVAAANGDPVAMFITQYGVDSSAENALRALPVELQHRVMAEGPLRGLNASALLMSRVRKAQNSAGGGGPFAPPPIPMGMTPM